VLVNIRSTDEFAKGHIEKALNIPVRELLQNRSLVFFRELKKTNTTAVLYGEDQLQANGPWLLLKQVGVNNVKVLQGGYAFYKTLPLADSLAKLRMADWNIESPQIDTSELTKYGQISGIVTSIQSGKKAPEKVIPVKKKGSTGGGC
jgi:rhodanese-related sulfurtransferase